MSIVIRVFDESGHIGYLGFNADGPYITSLAKAYEYDDFEGAQYDAQRFAMEHFGVFNTCPVVEESYVRFLAMQAAINKKPQWSVVSICAADPLGSYGILAKTATYALNFYACHEIEAFEVYGFSSVDGLPEQGVGYDVQANESPFSVGDIAEIIAVTRQPIWRTGEPSSPNTFDEW